MKWLRTDAREQGWRRCGESAGLPPVWSGCDYRTRCHTWVEFVICSRPAPRPVFLRVLRFSFLHENQHLQIPIQPQEREPARKPAKAEVACSPNIVIYLFLSFGCICRWRKRSLYSVITRVSTWPTLQKITWNHFSWPGFLNESLSLLFKLLPLKSYNNTQQLVLQSFHCDCVVHHHTATEVSRSVLGVWQLCVEVQTETGVIIHFFVSQHDKLPTRLP